MRDVLINTAVDETLARAIFHTICVSKASNHGESALHSLERLLLHAEGGYILSRRASDEWAIKYSYGLEP